MSRVNTYRRLLLAVVLAAAVILCPFLQEQAVAQVRDLGTRRLVLDNNAAGRIAIQTQATVTNNYSIALPTDTAGAHSGLLLFTNAGAGALTTSFLASGSNGQVLTISGGVPTWTTAASNWALLGNAATNPSLNFLGTTDGQPVVFRTDNVERMRLSGSATRLGIGNTNPTYTLDVTGDARFTTQIGVGVAPDVNLSARFRHPSSSTVLDLSTVNANDDAYFRFNDNTATRFAVGLDASQGDFRFNRSSVASLGANSDLIIDGTTGNVGVRVTSTPHRRLTVTEATNAATAVFGAALNTGQYTGLYISYYQEALGDVSQNAGIFFESTSNAFGTLHLVNKSSGTANATPADARLSVLSTGEVGIGTPTPASGRILHVAGTAGTSNVRMGSLSGAAVATSWTPTANDGIVVADVNGDLLKRSVSSVVGELGWSLLGNAGTSSATNFLGTTDNQALMFRVNNQPMGTLNEALGAVAFGENALQSNASGSALIAIGEDALRNTTDNSTLLGIGRYAGRSLTGGAGLKNNHFFLGHYAGENFDNDEDPVTIIGNYAYNQGGAGLGLVIVGYRAAFSMNSDNATVIGAHAGENIVSGSGSVIIGAQAMQTATSANNVVAIGENVMNSAIAPNSGNVAIGSGALQSLTTGSNNVGVGINVGNSLHTIGSGNVYLGANAGPSVGGLNNAIAIGQNSVVSQSNSLILGGTGADQVDVGIGVTAPTNRLHVVSTANPIRAVGLQSGAGTDSVVTVDATGVLRMRNASNFGGGIHEEVTAGQGNVRRRLIYTNGTVGAPVGQFSNDLQGSRTLATQTASGNFSVVPGGQNNTVSGSHSLAFGYGANVAQNNTIVFNHPTVGDGETRVGIDIDNPQTSLDVDGGVVVRPPAVVNVNANNFNLVVGNRSYIVLNPAGANRTGLILANGLQAGQMLILRIIDGQANTIQLPDNAGVNNVNTSGNWVGGQDDTMTLIWNGADWVELSRSNN